MLTVRPARPEDIDSIFALARDFATSFKVEETAFRDCFAGLLNAPNAHFAVAENDEVVVGYVLGFEHLTLYANGPVAWVEEIMVHSAHRRRGFGRLLMRDVECWAGGRGVRLIALATRRASLFYAALGYEESATYFRKLLP